MAKPWMADFGASGVLVASQTVIEPVGMVMANAVIASGQHGIPANSAEVSDASKCAMKGWEAVLTGLREKALELGAEGVLAIKLSQRDLKMGQGFKEFSGIGTAVRGLRRQEGVWTASIGPEEIGLLVGQGYVPVCFAVGCCTWHQSSYPWNPIQTSGPFPYPTQEIVPATKAFYTARSISMERMQQEGTKRGASGIVGVRIEMTKIHSEGMLYGFVAGCEAYGTGIARGRGEFRNGEIMCAVPLND